MDSSNVFVAHREQNNAKCSVIACVSCPGQWTNKRRDMRRIAFDRKSNLALLNWMSLFNEFGLQPRLHSSPRLSFPVCPSPHGWCYLGLCVTDAGETALCFPSPSLSSLSLPFFCFRSLPLCTCQPSTSLHPMLFSSAYLLKISTPCNFWGDLISLTPTPLAPPLP